MLHARAVAVASKTVPSKRRCKALNSAPLNLNVATRAGCSVVDGAVELGGCEVEDVGSDRLGGGGVVAESIQRLQVWTLVRSNQVGITATSSSRDQADGNKTPGKLFVRHAV